MRTLAPRASAVFREKANDANFLLSFAKIRPICAFRVKPCRKIKKMSSDLGKTMANDKHPPITNFSSDGNIEVFA